jgi:hypothetical protein
MHQAHDFGTNTAPSAQKPHWLTLVERGFRPVDKLDYLIRRWALEDSHSLSPYLMQTDALLSEPQRAIGRWLRRQYDLAQPLPDQLAALLTKVEQQPA